MVVVGLSGFGNRNEVDTSHMSGVCLDKTKCPHVYGAVGFERIGQQNKLLIDT